MLIFSAPEEKAVKAVLTSKNQKSAVKLSYLFAFCITISLIYGIITSIVNGFYTPAELFTDYMFTGLVAMSIFALTWSLVYVYKPVSKIRLQDNSGYQTIFESDCIKVLFPDEPEVIVPLDEIDEIIEYDIFYLIYCYDYKDEIVCSKNAIVDGTTQDFYDWCNSIDIPIKQNQEKKIYRSFFKKVDKEKRAGVSSIVFSALAALVVYPLFWLAIEVFLPFVPNLLTTLLATLWDLELIFIILLGLLFLPLGITATIISSLSALVVFILPLFLSYLAIKRAIKQIKMKKNGLGIIALILSIIVIIAIVLVFMWIANIF